MSVSSELLCSFELLKPLDSNALKSHIKKGRNRRMQMLNSPVCAPSTIWPTRPAWSLTDNLASLQTFIRKASRCAHGAQLIDGRRSSSTDQAQSLIAREYEFAYNKEDITNTTLIMPVEG